MCGHVGAAGTLEAKHRKVFTEMLFCDYLRGQASTGVAAINTRPVEPTANILKRTGPSYDLIDHKQFDKVVGASETIFIGHNRAPTFGANSNRNAHPFACGDIIGAHNGTLEWASKRELVNQNYFDTDSEALFNSFDEVGVDKTVSNLEGAWSLVWFNMKDKTLNFLRNDKRPMFVSVAKDGKQIFWASEPGLLLWILGRNDVDCEKPLLTTVDTWYKFIVPGYNANFELPKRFTFPEKPKVETTQYAGGYRHNRGTYYGERHPGHEVHGSPEFWKQKDRERQAKEAEEADKKLAGEDQKQLPFVPNLVQLPGLGATPHAGNVVALRDRDEDIKAAMRAARRLDALVSKTKSGKFRPPYFDHAGFPVPKVKFEKHVMGGCIFCECNAVWGDAVMFLPPDTRGNINFLCEDCLVNEETVSIARGVN